MPCLFDFVCFGRMPALLCFLPYVQRNANCNFANCLRLWMFCYLGASCPRAMNVFNTFPTPPRQGRCMAFTILKHLRLLLCGCGWKHILLPARENQTDFWTIIGRHCEKPMWEAYVNCMQSICVISASNHCDQSSHGVPVCNRYKQLLRAVIVNNRCEQSLRAIIICIYSMQ